MMAGGESWLDWVFKLFNFAVLVGVLIKFLGKPLREFLEKRQKAVKDKVAEAGSKLQEAEELRKKYETRLAGLDGEIEAFKKALLDETEKERNKIVSEAEALAARIREQARVTYEQEVREIKSRIREEIAQLTIDKAKKLLADKITKEDHDKMVVDFTEKLRSLN